MSRSRRKTPVTGFTTARSEKEDKRLDHRAERPCAMPWRIRLSPRADPAVNISRRMASSASDPKTTPS
jgi:hypothetical protein